MRAVSPTQVAMLVVVLIVGIAVGYAVGGAAAPPKTVTVTQAAGAVTQTVTQMVTQTATVVTTTTVRETVTQPTGLPREILIGALLPLSGDLAGEGALNRAAVEIAVDDLNNYVKTLGLPVTFRLIIEDSATDPTTALAKLQSLYARGVRVVVGPMSSAEVRNLKSYADGNKIVVCSQSSTAVDLAVPDYIFRDVPNDLFQAKAIARLMMDYGVKYAYILYRNDAWGKGLADGTEARYKEIGGTVLGKVGFDPRKGDFSAELAAAASAVRDAVNRYGAGSVGVLLISFEEGGTVTAQAGGYPELMGVTWFGSDGTAMNLKILEAAGTQLVRVKHLATIFAPTESPKFMDFMNKFRARTGELPGTYPATAYDCVWLLGLAIIQAGKYDGEAIKNAMLSVARNYFGVSGWTILDDNGDRASGDYDVWAVVTKDGKPSWEKVAVVDTTSDTVRWIKRI
ncbi:MAG TPA: ABC transporter substrate-binding protein [Sulfolobales archaeon]|nr:ABC transporter substrate-binding protein [Sulfolobales archaeon]